jgi:hypothetical protein
MKLSKKHIKKMILFHKKIIFAFRYAIYQKVICLCLTLFPTKRRDLDIGKEGIL